MLLFVVNDSLNKVLMKLIRRFFQEPVVEFDGEFFAFYGFMDHMQYLVKALWPFQRQVGYLHIITEFVFKAGGAIVGRVILEHRKTPLVSRYFIEIFLQYHNISLRGKSSDKTTEKSCFASKISMKIR
jgi:hypothetical protein